MYPILFDWNGIIIPAWHMFFAIGAICALYLFRNLNDRARSMTHKQVSQFYITAYIGGYLGARSLSIIIEEEHDSFVSSFTSLFELGAMTFYGGFIGCAIAAVAFSIFTKVSFNRLADIAIPSGFLGLSLGRIGCFLNGDDFGRAIDLRQGEAPPWWAVVFPNLQDGVYRIPSQLIEFAAVGLIVLLSVVFFNKNYATRPGVTAILAASSYAFYRYFADFLRGDQRGWIIDQILTPSQLVSVIILILSGLICLGLQRKQS